MSACEMCWYLASQDVQLFGGSVVDHYHRRIAEADEHPRDNHPSHTEPKEMSSDAG